MMVTSKGQVTIPVEIREKMGLLPHTEVAFKIVRGKVVLEKVASDQRGRAIIEHLRGSATAGMSTEEIMALTRG